MEPFSVFAGRTTIRSQKNHYSYIIFVIIKLNMYRQCVCAVQQPSDCTCVVWVRDRGATLKLGGGREGGTISDSILGGGHKTLFLTNSL